VGVPLHLERGEGRGCRSQWTSLQISEVIREPWRYYGRRCGMKTVLLPCGFSSLWTFSFILSGVVWICNWKIVLLIDKLWYTKKTTRRNVFFTMSFCNRALKCCFLVYYWEIQSKLVILFCQPTKSKNTVLCMRVCVAFMLYCMYAYMFVCVCVCVWLMGELVISRHLLLVHQQLLN